MIKNRKKVDVVGFDGVNHPLEEFDLIEKPWAYIPENMHSEYDPRCYCVIKDETGTGYLISVYDEENFYQINGFEKRSINSPVPTIVKSIDSAKEYVLCYKSGNKRTYNLNRKELRTKLNQIIYNNIENNTVINEPNKLEQKLIRFKRRK